MTRTDTRGGEPARTPPRPFTTGQTVRLKADPDGRRFVVIGHMFTVPARILVRRAEPYSETVVEHLVTRYEIEPDPPPPEPEGDDGTTGAGPIAWGPDNARGEFCSADGRFEVGPVGGQWRAIDWAERDVSPYFPLPADAVAWCERRLDGDAAAPDAPTDAPAKPAVGWEPFDDRGQQWSRDHRFLVQLWSGTRPTDEPEYEACDFGRGETACSRHDSADAARAWCGHRASPPGATITIDTDGDTRMPEELRRPPSRLVDVPGLSWRQAEAGGLSSSCGRFKIAPRLDDLGARKPGVFLGIDTRADDPGLRFSPDGRVDDVKEWCEERSGYSVARGVDGSETLEDIPF